MPDRSNTDLKRIRREYDLDQLDEAKLPEHPFQLFSSWLEEATRSKTLDPTAMTLSTVDPTGAPSSRIVLLKKIDGEKLIFFTNYRSRKAREIQQNANVAAHLYWPALERQVKISGIASPLEERESDHYFRTRPFESQISAWASSQDDVVPDRRFLEKEYRRYLEKFKGSKEIPRPAYWGGFAIEALRMEFWQGGKHRLHDRIEYTSNNKGWERVRLAP